MAFFDDIKESMGIPDGFSPQFRAVIIGDFSGYFEGVRSIGAFSPNQIVLHLRGATIKVSGEKLVIKKYCAGDVAVCGKITSIVRE